MTLGPPIRRGTACLGLAALTGCGANLMIWRQGVTGVLPDGSEVPLVVEVRQEHGMLEPEFDRDWQRWLPQAVVATILEPIDVVFSTAGAVEALFRDEFRVAGGPLGWFAALTPCATLCPGMIAGVRSPVTIDADQWRELQREEPWRRLAAARAVCHNDRVIDVSVGAPNSR